VEDRGEVFQGAENVSLPTPFYQDASCTIYNADCREILPLLPRFDLLLTDPPYGMNAMNGSRYRNKYGITAENNWDNKRPDECTFRDMMEKATDSIVWGMNYFCDMLPPHKAALVWHKPHIAHLPGRSDAELAFTTLSGGIEMVSMGVDSVKQHPTQKPLALIRWCLTIVPVAQTILDPFMGSGTTLVAAKLEGRKAVGIEISEKYCELAANRLRQKVLNFEEATP
jgi:tRNA G10  N-methylase Trm11